MSALAARVVTGAAAATMEADGGTVGRMLHAMAASGGSAQQVVQAPTVPGCQVTLGVAQHPWDRPVRAVAIREPVVVATDASLFHRADLLRRVRESLAVDPAEASDADGVLALHRQHGPAGVGALEGEFAFVLWDAARAVLVAARDFAGTRPLFFARLPDGIALATTVGGVLADPRVPRTLDLASLTTVAAGLWHHAAGTAYRAVEELPAGHLLEWSRETGVRITAFWQPPTDLETRRRPLDGAAEELRTLLVDAVAQRLAPTGVTGLSLSGGWDSTAVGAAATVALRGDAARRLQPVSLSYPHGDPGREDELIREVESHWGIATAWIAVDDIPLLGDAATAASRRDLPFTHTFEHWNRALSRRARAAGARVMFDGVGGDQLFQVSDIYLSDLFGRGHWIELARQWRARRAPGIAGWRQLWRWGIRPALPARVTHALARLRGTAPPRSHLERQAPSWFEPRWFAHAGIAPREADAAPRLPTASRVLAETHAFLRFPFFARITGMLRQYALEEGVRLHSPLLDDRVVAFAARRPWSDRADGRESKRLLRHAMRGLLPPSVLAPRPHRTGVTSAYFLRHLRGEGVALVDSLLQDPLLASLGIIDASRLRRAWDFVMTHDHDELGGRIFFTLQAELWLRAHQALLPDAR